MMRKVTIDLSFTGLCYPPNLEGIGAFDDDEDDYEMNLGEVGKLFKQGEAIGDIPGFGIEGPKVQLIFDPLDNKRLHPSYREFLAEKGVGIIWVPVHLRRGSLELGVNLFQKKTLDLASKSTIAEECYFLYQSKDLYFRYLDKYLHRDLENDLLPQEIAVILKNTWTFRLLFSPVDPPQTPYLLWWDGPSMSGQSAYLPHGEVEPYPDMDEGEKIVANWISERIRWD